MFIKEVEIFNIRNLKPITISLRKGVNLFIGDNGQGKTNFLESIYFLSKGLSFRPGKSEDVINKKSEIKKAFIKARIESSDLESDVVIKIEENKKNFFLNNKKVSSNQINRIFPCVIFSPESLSAIKSGPEERRQLIDDFLVSHKIENFDLVAEYRKCHKSRNKILRDYKQGIHDKKQVMDLLESLDPIFLPLATKLCVARIEALKAIQEDFKKAMKYILQDENVEIAVDYVISGESSLFWEQKRVYYALLNRLSELRTFELDSATTLIGPHKHDIQFLFEKEDSRYYCSQGQQRALILSFKMAQIMYHYRAHKQYPVLLLDDVLSELDPQKRSNLIKFLKGINSQIILTTTDLSFPKDYGEENLSVFHLEKGLIFKNECR